MVCILTAWKRDLLLLMQRTKIKTFFPMKRTLQYFLFLTTIKIGRTLRDVFSSYQFALDFFRASSKTWWSIERDVFFSSCHEHRTKEKLLRVYSMRNRTSDLPIPSSMPWPLRHRDSKVSEVYYEVYMTRVLHTVRISNVDSVMFVDRNKIRDGKFWTR